MRAARGTLPGRLALGLLVGLGAVAEGRADKHSGQCEAHYVEAQKARRGGKLRDAKRELGECLRQCSGAFAADCAGWLTEVEQAFPSVVLRARSAGGRELIGVRVWLDGALLAEQLDGRAIELDPGTHVFEFDHEQVRRRIDVLIRQGEKNRLLEVEFPARPGPQASQAPTASAVASAPAPAASSSAAPARTLATAGPTARPGAGFALPLAVSGGVLLLASGTLGYLTRARVDEMRKSCAPSCSRDEVGWMRTRLIVADVLLGAGVAALAGAAYLTWWSPSGRPGVASVSVGPGFAGVGGRF